MKSPANEGDRHGSWMLVAFVGMTRLGQQWQVRCDCGRQRLAVLSQLKQQVRRGHGECHCNAPRGTRIESRASVEDRAKRLTARYGDRAILYTGPAVDMDSELPERW